MSKTLTLIINPKSGTFSKEGFGERIRVQLERMGYRVSVKYTRGPGHATVLAAKAARRGVYAVLACGGDGTINEVAAGLINTNTALGILPAGSGNGLARHIGIPVDPILSLRVIEENNIELCDYGTVNGRPFFCTFGMGFDAAVSRRFSEKKRRGLHSYVTSALDEFITYRPDTYEIEIDGQVITDRAFMVAVCNASQYGNNAFIAPTASIQDGLLDVTIIYDGLAIENAWSGVAIFAGTIGNHGNFQTVRARELTIRRPGSSITHIDGEPVRLAEQLEIKCHPGALRVFMPRQKMRFIPILTPALLTVREWDIRILRTMRELRRRF